MHWIALLWQPEPSEAEAAASGRPENVLPSDEALGWWALQFTPRVAWLDEALLLEVSACERLWGGRLALLRQISSLNPAPVPLCLAQGATSLVALARLRMRARGHVPPADLPGELPLDTLSAAREHLDVLAHLGCRSWGEVAALPRGGLTRRFGKELRLALDAAYGLRPESHRWLTLPDVFDQKLELPALAEGAPELMWSANRLLGALQIWLRARQRGAVALELQWTLDLRRFNGVDLPPHQQIAVRTAEPTQDMAHLRRLMAERLALTTLAAPASWLRLRTLETTPWAGASTSFLPEDNRKGDKLHELVERLSVRLGAGQVLSAVAQADHRPEHRQAWRPALQATRSGEASARPSSQPVPQPVSRPDGLSPSWLLREPLRLELRDGHPCYRGVLRRLVGPQRLEAGWWGDDDEGADEDGDAGTRRGRPAVRDYFIAESPQAGLVWIFRERLALPVASDEPRWFLQGLYA
jgi:protein ImuB